MAARTGRPARAGARGDGRTDRTTALVGRGGTPEVVGTWPFRSCPPRRAVSGDGTTLHGRRPRTLLDAGLDQPAPRDSASEHGAPQACPGGLSLLARDAGVDHPARRYSASGCGPRGRKACLAGLSVLARAAWVDHPARRYSASGCGRRGRPAGPAGLGLQARGSTAGTAGLSLRLRGTTSLAGRTEPLCTGSVRSFPAGLSLQARAAGAAQPARRD